MLSCIDSVNISKELLSKLPLNLDPSKQGDDDHGLTNIMQKLVAKSLDLPSSRLLYKFLLNGKFPHYWKSGIGVQPIFKNKGSKSSRSNNRPVTLLSSLLTIFERFIYEGVLEHLQLNEVLLERQSGFLPGHDTQKQLVDIILSNVEIVKMETRSVSLDIAGAFDAVPYYLLLNKLHAYEIRGNLLYLMRSYLSGRNIKVLVKIILRSPNPTSYCDQPQGSILRVM
jgi:hypothetical protein